MTIKQKKDDEVLHLCRCFTHTHNNSVFNGPVNNLCSKKIKLIRQCDPTSSLSVSDKFGSPLGWLPSLSTVTTTISFTSFSHTRTRTTLYTLTRTPWIHSYYASTSCKQAAPLPCRRQRAFETSTWVSVQDVVLKTLKDRPRNQVNRSQGPATFTTQHKETP